MLIEFNKYEGAGNDFVIIDNRSSIISNDNFQLFKEICNRRFGVGADGLILIQDSDTEEFEMLYYNSDGMPC